MDFFSEHVVFLEPSDFSCDFGRSFEGFLAVLAGPMCEKLGDDERVGKKG